MNPLLRGGAAVWAAVAFCAALWLAAMHPLAPAAVLAGVVAGGGGHGLAASGLAVLAAGADAGVERLSLERLVAGGRVRPVRAGGAGGGLRALGLGGTGGDASRTAALVGLGCPWVGVLCGSGPVARLAVCAASATAHRLG